MAQKCIHTCLEYSLRQKNEFYLLTKIIRGSVGEGRKQKDASLTCKLIEYITNWDTPQIGYSQLPVQPVAPRMTSFCYYGENHVIV